MEIVDFALRRFLFLPDSCDAFEFLRDGWLARRASPLAWRWSKDPKIEVANDRRRGAYFAIIEPRDPCAAELYFHWVNEGSRGMARGSREQLKGVAARIRAAGGPFGSADVYFSNNLPPNELTVQPPAREPHVIPARQWLVPDKNIRWWDWERWLGFETRPAGAGFRFVIHDVDDRVSSALCEGPAGDFALLQSSRKADVVQDCCALETKLYGRTSFEGLDIAFGVNVFSEFVPMTRIRLPGLVGYCETALGRVFLVEVMDGQYALVLDARDGSAPRLITTSRPAFLRGYEVTQQLGREPLDMLGFGAKRRPASWEREVVSAEIENLKHVHDQVKKNLVWLVRTAPLESSETMRKILWALLLLFAGDCRRAVCMTGPELVEWLTRYKYLDSCFSERARQQALRMLDAKTTFVTRVNTRGSASRTGRRWRIDFVAIQHPTPEDLNRIGELLAGG